MLLHLYSLTGLWASPMLRHPLHPLSLQCHLTPLTIRGVESSRRQNPSHQGDPGLPTGIQASRFPSPPASFSLSVSSCKWTRRMQSAVPACPAGCLTFAGEITSWLPAATRQIYDCVRCVNSVMAPRLLKCAHRLTHSVLEPRKHLAQLFWTDAWSEINRPEVITANCQPNSRENNCEDTIKITK